MLHAQKLFNKIPDNFVHFLELSPKIVNGDVLLTQYIHDLGNI